MTTPWVFWWTRKGSVAWTGSTSPPPSLDSRLFDVVANHGKPPGPHVSAEAVEIAMAIAAACGRPSSEGEFARIDRALRRLRGFQC
jgi:hypothetical protein